MEAVEFIRKIKKMCMGRHCDECPLREKYKCNVIYTEDPEESVRIVEEWAKEQESEKTEQERQNPEQERQNPEQEKRLQDIEGKIRILWKKMQMMEEASEMQTKSIDALHDMFEKVRKDMRFADALLLLFMETESSERAKMEKRLTERI